VPKPDPIITNENDVRGMTGWRKLERAVTSNPVDIVAMWLEEKQNDMPSSEKKPTAPPPDAWKPICSSTKYIALLLQGLLWVHEHEHKDMFGPFAMLLATKVMDTINADPTMSTFFDLAWLPFVPAEFFFQHSDQGATLSQPFRVLLRLFWEASFRAQEEGEHPIVCWSRCGRYIRARDWSSLLALFDSMAYPADKFSLGQDEIADLQRNTFKLAGLQTKLKDDSPDGYNLILWSPLLIRGRPDMLQYISPRTRGVRKNEKKYYHFVEKDVLFGESREPIEPDWS
jgi:hypothetical protein